MKQLSNKNKFKIEKFRYLELKNFCRQYGIWRASENALTTLSQRNPDDIPVRATATENPVERVVNAAEVYRNRIKLIECCVYWAAPEIDEYLLKGVTEGLSYDILSARYNIPCSREYYYQRYRMFFWILNKRRDDGRF